MKIIKILGHVPQSIIHNYTCAEKYKKLYKGTETINIDKKPYWIGFFKTDFHHKWGKKIIEQEANIEIECWRPYSDNIDKVYSKKISVLIKL